MVLIGGFVTHVVSGFSIFEAVNGVLTEYKIRRDTYRVNHAVLIRNSG